jgi:ATP-binding cassette subfamily B (MDR/TAP) protein 1
METETPSQGKPQQSKEKQNEVHTISYFSLFKYTSGMERILLCCGVILAIIHGGMMPLFSLIFGQITADFTPDKPPEERRRLAAKSALYMFFVGLVSLVSSGLSNFCWTWVGNNLNIRVRQLYFPVDCKPRYRMVRRRKAEKMTSSYTENLAKCQGAVGK